MGPHVRQIVIDNRQWEASRLEFLLKRVSDLGESYEAAVQEEAGCREAIAEYDQWLLGHGGMPVKLAEAS